MNKRILGLALPNIITNITVPLLGMVDMAIVGHLSGDHIGAIAIGTQIFNLIYWNFGFLRMGTSGFTAQAFGAERWDETVKILIRACAIALTIALLLIALQWPISLAVPYIFESSNHVLGLALTYFFVRIWAAPATLGLYAIKGWFIGMQDSKTPMWIAIALNCVNILLSLIFVIVLKWDIAGVALGTVLANYSGLALGIIFLRRKFRRNNNLSTFNIQHSTLKEALRWEDMRRFFKVNGDIFLRTLCLSGVFTFITAASSHISDQILAVDALLLQFFTLFSYIMDGFAYAGESLVGRHIGAKQKRHLKLAVRLLIMWGMALTVVFTGLYAAFGNQFLHIFTDKQEIIDAAGKYMYWVLVIPVCGFAAFLFDGIFIGATATRTMRNAMFVATAAFFIIYYGLKYYGLHYVGHLTDHGWNNNLWTAFMVFLILRGLLQAIRVRKDIYSQAQ
ncbi:MAG: MATE family efflux transporter [Bacteroidales bacterium]|nr:MATE family efflux transporter [Bacteroidales bacterium]